MQRSLKTVVTLLAGACALAACADPATAPSNHSISWSGAVNGVPTSYILLGANSVLPASLASSVAAAGGTLTTSFTQIGVAVATSSDAAFGGRAAKIKGIVGVAEDNPVRWNDPNAGVASDTAGPANISPQPSNVGDLETFRLVQWAPDAVHAPDAWAQGQLGAAARVAILDGGIYDAHIDIAPNLDVAHSTSFVPGFAFNDDVGTFWHGTHVAGIVAADDNGIGTVGIAPDATIIGVKVLHNGSGSFAAVINGIIYAATPIAQGGAGANIINMSLGALFNLQGVGAAQLTNALSRATTYATQRGVLVVASAGNSAVDLDHSGNVVSVPAQSANVTAVSATGPLGWAVPGNTFDLDRPASYTNYGSSAIHLAGPGGDFVLPGNALCSKPRIGGGTVVAPCWVFDMVMAPCRGSGASISTYCWAAGTSMASPAVAGVAALIIGRFGPLTPAALRSKLQKTADDLGKPGNDPFYGGGRPNAGRAVQ